MDIINDCYRIAKKDYICDLCGECITKGSRYKYQFNKDGGETWSFRCHEDCDFLLHELWAYIDPYDYMDDTYFQEGVTSFCKQFICPNCSHYDRDFFNDCNKEEPYCLDKVVQLLKTHELHKERNYNNPIFVKWYLTERKQVSEK